MDLTRFDYGRLNALGNVPISRRSLFRRAAALGLATPVVAGLLAACGDGDDETDDGEDGATDPDTADDQDDEDVDADEPEGEDGADDREAQRGGNLRVGFSGSPDSFDPHHNVQLLSIFINSMMYSRLVRINTDMELEPDAALSWEPSDDGLEWTFELADGVMFHNGRACTAEDWVFSLDRLRDPDEGTPFVQDLEMIDEVEAVSDTELVFRLSDAYADLPILCGMYFMRVVPEEAADTLESEPVGTGPYRLQSHSPDERTVLERFEDYFLVDEEAFLDEIHYLTLAEETTRLTGLTGDSVDFVNEVSPSQRAIVDEAPNVVVEEMVTGSYQPICMRVDEAPFDDVRVRQALKLVIDREEFLQAALQGVGELANDQPIPPVDPMWADLPIPQRDIERAQELLAEAGYEDGLQIELHYTTGRVGLQESALSFQEMAQEAGVEVELTNHPNDSYWAEIWLNRPFYMSNWTPRPMADQALSVAFLTGAEWNESGWSNEEFDEIVREARSVLDEDERFELYERAQELIAEDGGVIVPYFMSITGAWNDHVHGFELHPLRWVELHKVWLDNAM